MWPDNVATTVSPTWETVCSTARSDAPCAKVSTPAMMGVRCFATGSVAAGNWYRLVPATLAEISAKSSGAK